MPLLFDEVCEHGHPRVQLWAAKKDIYVLNDVLGSVPGHDSPGPWPGTKWDSAVWAYWVYTHPTGSYHHLVGLQVWTHPLQDHTITSWAYWVWTPPYRIIPSPCGLTKCEHTPSRIMPSHCVPTECEHTPQMITTSPLLSFSTSLGKKWNSSECL